MFQAVPSLAREQIFQIYHSLIGQNIGEATASTPLGCYINPIKACGFAPYNPHKGSDLSPLNPTAGMTLPGPSDKGFQPPSPPGRE